MVKSYTISEIAKIFNINTKNITNIGNQTLKESKDRKIPKQEIGSKFANKNIL